MAQPPFAAPASLFAGTTPTASTPSAALTTTTTTPPSGGSASNTFVMATTPSRSRRSAADSYKPKIISTIGAKPACLVNASVTYVGNDQIYAFGGFDQFTDEGE